MVLSEFLYYTPYSILPFTYILHHPSKYYITQGYHFSHKYNKHHCLL